MSRAGADGIEARSYRVRGRVQGVGFRWWTRRTAEGLGVAGSVRNVADGSVAIRAFGPATVLDALEDKLRRGPPGARVDAVEIVATGSFDGRLPADFRIEA